jgi:DNA adenine methylase
MEIKPCKSPIPRMGGKHYLAKWINSYFPEHKIYVEPFGGGAHVLCNKNPYISKLEVYNDSESKLVNIFKAIMDDESRELLIKKLMLTPYSRELFYEIRSDKYKAFKDEFLNNVFRDLILMRQSFGGDWTNRIPSWGYIRTRNKMQVAFGNFPEKLMGLVQRFRMVQIENLDFRKIIKNYDSPDTLFYCDPPYIKKENYYEGSFNQKDHEELAEILNNIKGKAILSYYPCKLVRDSYWKNGWKIVQKKINLASAKVKQGEIKKKVSELLIMNY